MSRTHPLLAHLGPATALAAILSGGCLGQIYEYADDIACKLHSDCPDGQSCFPELGTCVHEARDRVFCLSDEQCLRNEHCQDSTCVQGPRITCDPQGCLREDSGARCTFIDDAPRCQPAECGSDFSCGPNRICQQGACTAATRSGGARWDGDACQRNADCASGECVVFDVAPEQAVCVSFGCEGEPYLACGPKAVCSKVDDICIPRGARAFQEPCDADLQCRGGLCVDQRCSNWCRTDEACDAPARCVGLLGIDDWGGCHVP